MDEVKKNKLGYKACNIDNAYNNNNNKYERVKEKSDLGNENSLCRMLCASEKK